jgi:cytochrome P450
VGLEGVLLEPGDRVGVYFAAANRDPQRWSDPERFNIGRKPVGHLALGYGVHACLGQTVARRGGAAAV